MSANRTVADEWINARLHRFKRTAAPDRRCFPLAHGRENTPLRFLRASATQPKHPKPNEPCPPPAPSAAPPRAARPGFAREINRVPTLPREPLAIDIRLLPDHPKHTEHRLRNAPADTRNDRVLQLISFLERSAPPAHAQPAHAQPAAEEEAHEFSDSRAPEESAHAQPGPFTSSSLQTAHTQRTIHQGSGSFVISHPYHLPNPQSGVVPQAYRRRPPAHATQGDVLQAQPLQPHPRELDHPTLRGELVYGRHLLQDLQVKVRRP